MYRVNSNRFELSPFPKPEVTISLPRIAKIFVFEKNKKKKKQKKKKKKRKGSYLLSQKNCLKKSLQTRNSIYIRNGCDTSETVTSSNSGSKVIKISASSNPVVFGTVRFIPRECFQRYIGLSG